MRRQPAWPPAKNVRHCQFQDALKEPRIAIVYWIERSQPLMIGLRRLPAVGFGGKVAMSSQLNWWHCQRCRGRAGGDCLARDQLP